MEKLISLEDGMTLKELGFDQECFFYFWEEKNGKINTMHGIKPSNNKQLIWSSENHQRGLEGCRFCSAPSQGHVQKWLREEHNISIELTTDWVAWECDISTPDHGMWGVRNTEIDKSYFSTYEDALDAGIKNALNFIQNEKTN